MTSAKTGARKIPVKIIEIGITANVREAAMDSTNASTAFERVLIMGNGGSGKTWLARRIGEQLRHPIIHLNDIHWEPGRYGIARDRTLRTEVKAAANDDRWIMEGVYGQLVNMVLRRVTALIWIDLPEEACIANVT